MVIFTEAIEESCVVLQCNFFDHRGLKVVYRRYTAFCFVTGITHDEVRLASSITFKMLSLFICSLWTYWLLNVLFN